MNNVFKKKIASCFLLAVLLTACNSNDSAVPLDKKTDSSGSAGESAVSLKLKTLTEEVKNENLTFTVGMNPVSYKEISEITGEKVLADTANTRIQKLLQKADLANKDLDRADPFISIKGVSLSPAASKLDLRDYGLVTPVKDQGSAGACWAFGSMAAYESDYEFINTKEINTSEQYVINCSGAGTAAGGGLAFDVFMWMVKQNRNVDDEAFTPYIAQDALCSSVLPKTNYYAIRWDLVDPAHNPGAIPTVKQIKEAMCKYGVISVSVYVSDLFQAYTGGIFNEKETANGTNHAISLVGWDDSKNAWILKNSWGNKWGESCGSTGEKGYMWITYNSNNVGRRAAWVIAKKVAKK
jgi:cathepsin K